MTDYTEDTDECSDYNLQDIIVHGCVLFCVITQLPGCRSRQADKFICLGFMQICPISYDREEGNIL